MKSRKLAVVAILIFQTVLIILYALFVKYDADAEPKTQVEVRNDTVLDSQYPMFQDIHVMIFVGFGFLMTFLRRYAFGALGFTFLVAAIVMQWGLLCQGFFHLKSTDDWIHMNITSIINADIVAAVILISFGAVIGKISPIQLFLMAVLETAVFAANEYIGTELLEAVDPGGSVYVHTFGAYFGLAVSVVLPHGVSSEDNENNLESSNYQSDINAMIGALFLWLFWPSFNAGLLSGDEKHRAVLNTYLSLAASCVTVFIMSMLFDKQSKFDMVHVQNATLAGGVCIGTSCNMMVHPYGALIIGSFAGFLSTVGFRFMKDFIAKKLRIHDTCGVHNLHGMPGVAAGIIATIMTWIAGKGTYGEGLYRVFPAMGNSKHRTANEQAEFQLAALATTLGISIVSGLITGALIGRVFRCVEVLPPDYYDDQLWWNMESNDKQNDK